MKEKGSERDFTSTSCHSSTLATPIKSVAQAMAMGSSAAAGVVGQVGRGEF
jgi:hypothetical protein